MQGSRESRAYDMFSGYRKVSKMIKNHASAGLDELIQGLELGLKRFSAGPIFETHMQ